MPRATDQELAAAEAQAQAICAEQDALTVLQTIASDPQAPPELLLNPAVGYVTARINLETMRGIPITANQPAIDRLQEQNPQDVADMFAQLAGHEGQVARFNAYQAIVNMVLLSPSNTRHTVEDFERGKLFSEVADRLRSSQ